MTPPDHVMVQEFNNVINIAIDDDEPKTFLRLWREGDFKSLHKEWGFETLICVICYGDGCSHCRSDIKED